MAAYRRALAALPRSGGTAAATAQVEATAAFTSELWRMYNMYTTAATNQGSIVKTLFNLDTMKAPAERLRELFDTLELLLPDRGGRSESCETPSRPGIPSIVSDSRPSAPYRSAQRRKQR